MLEKIRLFINWFEVANPIRGKEYLFVLQKNIGNAYIDEIHVFCEKGKVPPVLTEKCVFYSVESRRTYADFLRLMSTFDGIRIIANLDIFFDDTIALTYKMPHDECFALSRWEDTERLFDRKDSQDVWIFNGLIKKIDADFELGRIGCDNRFAYELQKAGYVVRNPSRSIKAYHVHNTLRDGATRTKRIQEPYRYVSPEVL
jgi:hypothetical protein